MLTVASASPEKPPALLDPEDPMQQEPTPVCRCGYENPGKYCPDCGARQPKPGNRPSTSIADSPSRVIAVLAVVVIILAGAYFIFIHERPEGGPDGIFSSPPPIHEIVTCREMADRWTLDNEDIRKITRVSSSFRGHDLLRCRGYADIEWGADQWVTLTAERDYEGNIQYRMG